MNDFRISFSFVWLLILILQWRYAYLLQHRPQHSVAQKSHGIALKSHSIPYFPYHTIAQDSIAYHTIPYPQTYNRGPLTISDVLQSFHNLHRKYQIRMKNHLPIFAAPSPGGIETEVNNMANQDNGWETLLYCGLP